MVAEGHDTILNILSTVPDPEVPVLSVLDLGIVRDIKEGAEGVEITITPTYSGCPAMDAIAMDIRLKLLEHGYKNIFIKYALSPAWTTDWMTEEGKRKLVEYGIAAPYKLAEMKGMGSVHPPCPRCKSGHTQVLSEFGSTPCKALYQCLDCLEPFDYFKCH